MNNKQKKQLRYYQRNRYYKKTRKDKEEVIRVLEMTGKRIDYISPSDINDRLEQLYDRIDRCQTYLENPDKYKLTPCRIEVIKKMKKNYTDRFINLSTIIIGAVIAKQKTLRPFANEMSHECVIAILRMLKKRNYKKGKSKLSSQVYETCRQALKQFGTSQIAQENKSIRIIDI